VNTEGSFQCDCPLGHELSPSREECIGEFQLGIVVSSFVRRVVICAMKTSCLWQRWGLRNILNKFMPLLYMSIFKLKRYNRCCKISDTLNAVDFKEEYFSRPLEDYLAAQRTVPLMLATFKLKTYKHKVNFIATVKNVWALTETQPSFLHIIHKNGEKNIMHIISLVSVFVAWFLEEVV